MTLIIFSFACKKSSKSLYLETKKRINCYESFYDGNNSLFGCHCYHFAGKVIRQVQSVEAIPLLGCCVNFSKGKESQGFKLVVVVNPVQMERTCHRFGFRLSKLALMREDVATLTY